MTWMRWGAVLCTASVVLAAHGACTGAAAVRPVDHGALEALDRDAVIVPGGEPASALESRPVEARTLAPLDHPLRWRLIQGYQRAGAAAGIAVVPDERLDRAMADLARSLDDGEHPRSEAVDFLLGFHGIIEPYPELLVMRANQQGYDDLLARLFASPKLPRAAIATVGVGIDASNPVNRIVVALQEKYLDLEPVVRRQPRGARFELVGSLLGAFSNPTLYVTLPSGAPSKRSLHVFGTAFRAALACDHGDGRYQIEVFGSDASGPRVLANFSVFCGVEPPAVQVGHGGFVPTPVGAGQAERELFALINQARATAGLAALAFDPELARVARAHSSDMLASDYIAHISPTSGTPTDRAARAGIYAFRLVENVGTAASPDDLHHGLMRSPGHRAAILDPEVMAVGIGVAVPPGDQRFRVVATELFR